MTADLRDNLSSLQPVQSIQMPPCLVQSGAFMYSRSSGPDSPEEWIHTDGSKWLSVPRTDKRLLGNSVSQMKSSTCHRPASRPRLASCASATHPKSKRGLRGPRGGPLAVCGCAAELLEHTRHFAHVPLHNPQIILCVAKFAQHRVGPAPRECLSACRTVQLTLMCCGPLSHSQGPMQTMRDWTVWLGPCMSIWKRRMGGLISRGASSTTPLMLKMCHTCGLRQSRC